MYVQLLDIAFHQSIEMNTLKVFKNNKGNAMALKKNLIAEKVIGWLLTRLRMRIVKRTGQSSIEPSLKEQGMLATPSLLFLYFFLLECVFIFNPVSNIVSCHKALYI